MVHPRFTIIMTCLGVRGFQRPSFIEVLSKLRGMGYFASRTHFSDTGLRTDAPFEELLQVFRSFAVIR